MPGLAPYKRILAADARTTIEARGTTVFLRKATGELLVTLRSTRVGTGTGAAYSLRMTAAEKWFHAEEFDSVELLDTSGAANTIEFYIGYGDFEKPVPDIVNVAVTSAVNASVDTTVDNSAFGTGNANAVEVLAANPLRTAAVLTALASNADTLRIGDSDVDTDQGTPLAPGETILWPSKAGVFVCSESGIVGANDIALLEHLQ